jgi:hypothetical protein
VQASKLVRELAAAIAAHGDLDVVIAADPAGVHILKINCVLRGHAGPYEYGIGTAPVTTPSLIIWPMDENKPDE